jgi:hypothetical protein
MGNEATAEVDTTCAKRWIVARDSLVIDHLRWQRTATATLMLVPQHHCRQSPSVTLGRTSLAQTTPNPRSRYSSRDQCSTASGGGARSWASQPVTIRLPLIDEPRVKLMAAHSANLPDESLPPMGAVETGVYFGFAQVIPTEAGGLPDEDKKVHPMVMSLGWNPFYKNERLTAVRCCASAPSSRVLPPILPHHRKFMLCTNLLQIFTARN